MNKVILVGRITKKPEVRYTQNENHLAVTRYTLAVDRRYKRDGEQSADFIQCIVFGKSAEFAEKYLDKGTKIVIEGHIQTGSYEKDGQKIYTTDVVVEQQEFAESKKQSGQQEQPEEQPEEAPCGDGFMNIPEGLDEELPFN